MRAGLGLAERISESNSQRSLLIIVSILVALLVSAVTTWRLAKTSARLRLLDEPNERSLHHKPIPRTGGIGILGGAIVGGGGVLLAAANQMEWLAWVVGAASLVAVVSFFDDRSGLPVTLRLLTHVIAASLLLNGIIPAELVFPGASWAWPVGLAGFICLAFVVWMTNLYNFMDGMDGFAGGMAVIGFGTFGLLGWLAGDVAFAGTSWVLMAAAGGFLISNFPPARIFMGDTGSSALGFWPEF